MIAPLAVRWLLTAVFAAAALGAALPRRSAVAAAGYCATASIPWLVRAVGPGARVDPAAASQAAMSAGMAAMLLAML